MLKRKQSYFLTYQQNHTLRVQEYNHTLCAESNFAKLPPGWKERKEKFEEFEIWKTISVFENRKILLIKKLFVQSFESDCVRFN